MSAEAMRGIVQTLGELHEAASKSALAAEKASQAAQEALAAIGSNAAPTTVNLGRQYLLGAPLRKRSREEYVDGVFVSCGTFKAVREQVLHMLSRTTDKSIGLLQGAGIFAAIAIFVAQREAETNLVSIAAVILFLVASVALTSNLGLIWRSNTQRHLDTREYSLHLMQLVCSRVYRFNFALTLIILAVTLLAFRIGGGALE